MENKTLSYIAIGLAVLALLVGFLGNRSAQTAHGDAFERVMSSGTIRAGYIAYPPYIIKDPNTGELSGVFYDLTNEVAKQLGLKVEWVEEAGYGTIFTNLDTNRYDVFGGGLWANSTRAKAGYLSIPVFYNSVYAYARTNDTRFNSNLEAINNSSVRISTMDGELGDVIASTDFPNAQKVSLPQNSPFDQIALQIVANKADVGFFQPDVAEGFIKANPNSIRQVSEQPLRLYGNVYAVKMGEAELQQMFNVALQEAIDSGAVAKILAKYQTYTASYLQPAAPFAQ